MEQLSVVGSRTLVSLEVRCGDGPMLYPHGGDAIGRLTYDGARHMAVQLGSVDRPVFAAGDPLVVLPGEAKIAIDIYTAYFGSYELDREQGIVTHHIDASVFPNWSGSEQRRFELSDDRLTLSTLAYRAARAEATSHLIWEREQWDQ